jgi:hypothetical protein
MNERSEQFSDFDSHRTPEEMEQDWIDWNEDLRDELKEIYRAMDEEGSIPWDEVEKELGLEIDDDETPEGWDCIEEDDFNF